MRSGAILSAILATTCCANITNACRTQNNFVFRQKTFPAHTIRKSRSAAAFPRRRRNREAGQRRPAVPSGRILTLPPERRSPTRQVLKSTRKRAGSEIGAPRCQSSRGQCQEDAPVPSEEIKT